MGIVQFAPDRNLSEVKRTPRLAYASHLVRALGFDSQHAFQRRNQLTSVCRESDYLAFGRCQILELNRAGSEFVFAGDERHAKAAAVGVFELLAELFWAPDRTSTPNPPARSLAASRR